MATSSIQKNSRHNQNEIINSWNVLKQEFPEIPEPYSSDDSELLNAAVSKAEEMELNIRDELDYRKDLRQLPTATIDPDYAHDHDDAVSLLEDGNGYRAWVHIADVGHYVDPGDPIDQAARDRGVTFYLGDNTRHMLPDYLAQEICSLKPDTDRLAHTVEMKFDQAANLKDWDVYKSVIKSDAHLTYTHADNIIDSSEQVLDWYEENELGSSEKAMSFKEMCRALSDLDPVTRDLRDERWDHSLIINDRQSKSSRIIEEMMIAANWSVGQYLREEAGLGMYREEESPDNSWTREVNREISALGFELPDQVHNSNHTKRVLNDFFKQTDFETNSLEENKEKQARDAIVMNLPRASYTASKDSRAVNHYGLGIGDYAHFTSPIRRYSDLVNHWIISDVFDEERNMPVIAEHVSSQQKAADESNRLWEGAQ